MVRRAAAFVALAVLMAAAAGTAAAAAGALTDEPVERVTRNGQATVTGYRDTAEAKPPTPEEPPPAGPELKPGFPADVYSSNGTYKLGSSAIVVGDIDGDPGLEVLLSGLHGGRATVVEPDGTPVEGWPSDWTATANYLGLAEMDLARPGFEVTVGGSGIIVLDGHGNPLPGWLRDTTHGSSRQGLSAADLTGDRRDEVASNHSDYKYWSIDAEGQIPENTSWPQRVVGNGQDFSQPALADLDGDGDREVVGGGNTTSYDEKTNMAGFDGDGTPLPGWVTRNDRFNDRSRMVVGNVDAEPGLEVVARGQGSYQPDGSPANYFQVWSYQPSLGDIDEDGNYEIIDLTADLYVRQGESRDVLPGFPIATGAESIQQDGVYPPVVVDMDNDGDQDIVYAWQNEDRLAVVGAVDRTGTMLPGFPFVVPVRLNQAIAAADIDNNGRTDLLVAGSSTGNGGWNPGLYAYEYPTGQAAAPDWTQYGGGPQHQFVVGQSLRPPAGPAAAAPQPGHLSQLADLAAGAAAAAPRDLTVLGDRLLFSADTADTGRELWASDGTAAGTSQVLDALPGPGSAQPTKVVAAGGAGYFAMSDGQHGRELWRTDGTAAGTSMVTDLAAGAPSSDPRDLTTVGERLFFTADSGTGREVYVTDGTDTRLVFDSTSDQVTSDPGELAEVGGRVVWNAQDWVSNPTMPPIRSLFSSDGTAAGTEVLPTTWWPASTKTITSSGSVAALTRYWQLTWTDGTVAGTSNEEHSSLLSAVALRGEVGLASALVHDEEGVRVDAELKRLTPGSWEWVQGVTLDGRRVPVAAPADFMTYGDGWLFTARERTTYDRTLWYAGESGLAREVAAFDDAVIVPLLADGDMALLRIHRPADGDELWRTDGTQAGTTRIADLAGGPAGSQVTEPVVFGDRIYFAADDRVSGREMWSMPRDLLGPLPDTVITDRPPARTSRRRTLITFTSTPSTATFECRLDQAEWTLCASPWRSKVAPGRHRFRVRATNELGLVESKPATVRWRVRR